jgi:hypothetical protein
MKISYWRFILLGIAALPLVPLACGGDVVDTSASSASGAGGAGGTGSAGSTGSASSTESASSAGSGGGAIDGGAPDNGKYSARNLYTGVPRFAVFKADEVRDICVRIILQASNDVSSGLVSPEGWAISKAEVTDHASDCLPGPNSWPEPPVGASADATGGTGSMTLSYPNGPPMPCLVTVHGTLEFAPGAPSLPTSEPLDADNVEVVGGCS